MKQKLFSDFTYRVLDLLAQADGIALGGKDHAVEGIAEHDERQFAALRQRAAEEVACHCAGAVDAEREGARQGGELGAVLLKALPFFL